MAPITPMRLVLHDEGRGVVSEIEYLDTRSRSEGNKIVRFLPNRWLSRVLARSR
jgi:hypothetical protein